MASSSKVVLGKKGERRVKDVELCLPICAGTVSFWQGKKVSERAHDMERARQNDGSCLLV